MNELELFAAAIAISDSGQRAQMLDRECAGRPDLRARLEELLATHGQPNPLLDQPPPAAVTTDRPRDGGMADAGTRAETAGTIIAGGGVGPRCGAGMKRGTIVTFGPEFARAPGCVYACDYWPAYAEIVRRELTDSIDRPIDSVHLYRGDLITGGRGEIWHIPQFV